MVEGTKASYLKVDQFSLTFVNLLLAWMLYFRVQVGTPLNVDEILIVFPGVTKGMNSIRISFLKRSST